MLRTHARDLTNSWRYEKEHREYSKTFWSFGKGDREISVQANERNWFALHKVFKRQRNWLPWQADSPAGKSMYVGGAEKQGAQAQQGTANQDWRTTETQACRLGDRQQAVGRWTERSPDEMVGRIQRRIWEIRDRKNIYQKLELWFSDHTNTSRQR